MKKRGVSRFAALLVVLLMMMSAAAMLPSQDATAQTREIWGYVKAGSPIGPVEGALVSLADVHGLDPTVLTSASGKYSFSVGAGFYEIEVSKEGYFSQMKGPFRFDATSNMKIADFILEQTPALDFEISGSVLSSVTNQVSDEEVVFDTKSMPEENVTENFTFPANTVYLGSPPVVGNSETGWWHNESNTNVRQLSSANYEIDYFSGVVTITNPTIAQELGNGLGWLSFTYDNADNKSNLANGYITVYQAKKNGSSWPEAGNFRLDKDTGDVEVIGNFVFGVDVLKFDYTYHPTPLDAEVKIFNVSKNHEVSFGDAVNGPFTLSSWAGDFELQAWADGYQPNITSVRITGDLKTWILMDPAIKINGFVDDESGTASVENVRAFLFCKDPVPESIKILEANVPGGGSYYEFDTFPGSFILYVDADGYQAQYKPIDVMTSQVHDFALSLSDEESIETSVGFVGDDWNEIAVYKNLTLNNDSHLPSLGTSNFGSLALEIDWTIGNKDGDASASEWSAFATWLEDRGPQFLKTSGFFTTEQEEYTLKATGYSVTVNYDNQNVWIETVAMYNTSEIEHDLSTYDLNLKAAYDETILIGGEDKTITNYTYWIDAPAGYELVWNSSVNTDVIGFTDILVDPKKGTGSGTVVLTLGRSDSGIAIVEVTGPLEGEDDLYVYHFPDNELDDYRVIVPAETEIQFSAAKSTDPHPNDPERLISPYAEFTWRFGDGNTGTGISPTHNYSDPGTGSADYTVNLTIREPDGNYSWREISVKVDARIPNALVWYDEADIEEDNGDLHVKEDIKFDFSANYSTDLMWDGEDGNITRYEWDFDSDGIPDAFTETLDTEFFIQPGEYILNLTVWDWVGHKSDNYTRTIFVGDATPPVVAYRVMNSTFVETLSPLEQEIVYFNASDTTDNFSTLENLTFDWMIEETNMTGENITHVFSESGTFEIVLKATDEAGNAGFHNTSLIVLPDRSLHSHISIHELTFSPESPEVGQTVKISVIVNNTDEGVAAEDVTVRFWVIGEEEKEIKGTVKYYDENRNQVSNATLATNTNLTAEISWKPGSHGDYTIKVNVTASNELEGGRGDNSVQDTLTVKEPGYVTPLIIGVLVLLIFLIAIILLLRRKFAGRFPRLSREKKPEKEKKKKRVKK